MFFIIFVMLYGSFATGTDDLTIVFNVYRTSVDYLCGLEYRPIAVEDNAASIRVYVNSSVDITRGYCLDLLPVRIELIKTKHNNTFFVEKQYVFKNTNYNIWTCFFSGTRPNPLNIACETLIHIRTKTPDAQMYLNSTKVVAIPTPLEVRAYDAAASYYFEDDETIVIGCKRSQQIGYSKITYYNSTGGILLDTAYSPIQVEVHIKLSQDSHHNYVDCYYTIDIKKTYYSYEDVSVTRIFFMSQSAENSENNFASKYWIWISSCIVMIVITIITVCIIKNFKDKRKMRQSSNMDLLNSPNNGNGTLPHPRRWEEDLIEPEIYNEPNHENRIIINEKRAKEMNNETSKNYSDSNYANVDNTNHHVVTEPTLIYADILTVNNEKNFENADEVNYSQVRYNDTITDGGNYENISLIQGPSYVNSHVGKEEAEPAYCEVQAQAHVGMR